MEQPISLLKFQELIDKANAMDPDREELAKEKPIRNKLRFSSFYILHRSTEPEICGPTKLAQGAVCWIKWIMVLFL